MSKQWIIILTLIVSLGPLVKESRSQNFIMDQERQQKQIDSLTSDVDELKRTVESLRRMMLPKSVASQKLPAQQTPAPSSESITLSPEEQEKAKTEVCSSLGRFFDQIDRALKMPDPAQAESYLRESIVKLNTDIDKYRQIEEIREIKNLAEGLAWDTYVAVENRNSVYGNAEFLNYINTWRNKFHKRCPAR